MKYIVLVLSLFFTLHLNAQNTPEYSRVKIHFSEEQTIEKLNTLGVLCHGNHAKGRHFTSDFSSREIRIIKEAGFEVEVLIEDVQAHYVAQNNDHHGHDHEHRGGQVDCNNASDSGIITPDNFELGSIGGYLTYAEILAELDQMKALYPNLISTKAPISTTLTHEGRPIHWVRLSDNPETDEAAEPEILYNSLTHAREPGGMMQMIFYMWYLLENYDSDDEIKYLVDNVEMYFIPCINPDGYVYNETTNPNGGGLWRKNRRDNGDGTFGVDLNRNFGYAFAYNDNGSSPNTNSDTYRGPSAFSEPESQNLKMFVEAHDFKISMNYHTYSKLLLRPWGHIADLPDDINTFDDFGSLMVEDNGYAYGGSEILGYFVNGDTDSYMYGDHDIISYTPEVGSSFWPAISEIENDGKDNLNANLYAARFVLNYGRGTESINNEQILNQLTGTFDFNIKKYGLKPGSLTVSLSCTDATSITSPVVFNLNHLEEGLANYYYELDPNLQEGTELTFKLLVDNGEHVFEQEFKKTYTTSSTGTEVVSDMGDNMNNWENSSWGITNARFFSAPTSIADSPQGDYPGGNTSFLILNTPLNLSTATEAYISFRAEWDIEASYDYCQLQAGTETISYEPLCGLFTKEGSVYQDTGEPIWDGVKTGWVTEKLLLDDYLGNNEVNLRFRLVADNFVQGDGFFFDDFTITVTDDSNTATYEFTADDFTIETYPNPITDILNIKLSELPENTKIVFYNALGQEILINQLNQENQSINISDLSNGMYFYSIYSDGKLIGSRKVVVSK